MEQVSPAMLVLLHFGLRAGPDRALAGTETEPELQVSHLKDDSHYGLMVRIISGISQPALSNAEYYNTGHRGKDREGSGHTLQNTTHNETEKTRKKTKNSPINHKTRIENPPKPAVKRITTEQPNGRQSQTN